jgi:hypothetical protein
MTLQLHDEGLDAPSWLRRGFNTAVRYAPNPYYQAARAAFTIPAFQRFRPRFLREEGELSQPAYTRILDSIQGTPTYYQFLQETGSTGLEDSGELSGRFGTWLRTKALPAAQRLQTRLAPIISMIPGGGVVNQAFDLIRRPADGSVPGPTTEPVPAMPLPMAPTPLMPQPAPMLPQLVPQVPIAPAMPNFIPEPAPQMPFFTPAPAPAPQGPKLPFGLTLPTLALLGLGGLLLVKTLKK